MIQKHNTQVQIGAVLSQLRTTDTSEAQCEFRMGLANSNVHLKHESFPASNLV